MEISSKPNHRNCLTESLKLTGDGCEQITSTKGDNNNELLRKSLEMEVELVSNVDKQHPLDDVILFEPEPLDDVIPHQQEPLDDVILHKQPLDEVMLHYPFQTLVFFDVEATGLRSSTNKPRITELSLVAVDTNEFLGLEFKLRNCQDVEKIAPRVLNKLTICLNPSCLILPHVTDLTGLDNYNLETQNGFSEQTAMLLSNYLQHLPKPVCLVAHNGFEYDFPLLRSELILAGSEMEFKTIDSLIGLRIIFSEKIAEKSCKPSFIDFDPSNDFTFQPLNFTKEEEDQVSTYREVLEETQEPSANSTPVKASSSSQCYRLPITPPQTGHKRPRLSEFSVAANSFPMDPIDLVESDGLIRVCSTNDLYRNPEVTPDRGTGLSHVPDAPVKTNKFKAPPERMVNASRAKKRLKFSDSLPQSFSLPKLHEHIFGKGPSASHGAEADCMALMRVCAYHGQAFVNYALLNSKLFTSVAKMW